MPSLSPCARAHVAFPLLSPTLATSCTPPPHAPIGASPLNTCALPFHQRHFGLPLSVILDGQCVGDPFGDLAVNKEQISTRHARTLHARFAAIRVVAWCKRSA
eukprot:6182971-Pleurochrysis_carterae.AAC.2